MSKGKDGSVKIIFGVVGLMLLSRVLGLVRDIVINGTYGLSLETDAYFAAVFLTTGIFLSVGSALANTTIPYVVRASKGDHNHIPIIGTSVLAIGLILTLLYTFISPVAVGLYIPGDKIETLELTIRLTRILVPSVFLVIMTYLCIGILQGNERFGIPAMVSIPFNLLFFAYIIVGDYEKTIVGLAWVTAIGWGLQLTLVGVPVIKGKMLSGPTRPEDWKVLKGFYLSLLPIVIITFTHQMNLMIDFRQANSFMVGSGSAITYGNTLFKALVTTAVYGVTAVMFPKFNRKFLEEDKAGLYQSVINVLRSVILLLVPMSVGLIVFGDQVVYLIYPNKSPLITTAFSGYTSFMIAFGMIDVVNKAFYTMSNRRVPLMMTGFITVANVVFSTVITSQIGFGGIPMGTAIAYYCGAVLALYLFLRAEDQGGKGRLIGTFIRSLLAALVMGGVVWGYKLLVGLQVIKGIKDLIALAIGILIGIGVYAIMLVLVREELVVYNLKQVVKKFKG